jgi:hypothetical protein
MREIRINAPGAGEWIMERLGGIFTAKLDHSFSTHDGDRILGGFVVTWFLGGSLTVHMASQDPHWCTRELLWMIFHFAFEQLGVYKMITPIASDNASVASMDMRAGWNLEAVIKDAYKPGVHMLILTMTKVDCPWLDYKPKQWKPGDQLLITHPAGSA